MLKRIFILLLALISANCLGVNYDNSFSQTKTEITREALEAERYAVYDALLNYLFSEVLKKTPSIIVIEEHTKIWYSNNIKAEEVPRALSYLKLPDMQKRLPSLSAATFDDFIAQNQVPVSLKDSFSVEPKRVILSAEEQKSLFSKGWQPLHKKYPNSQGLTTLSNVGFDGEMKQALVHIISTREAIDGLAFYAVLEKQNGKWQVKEKYIDWEP